MAFSKKDINSIWERQIKLGKLSHAYLFVDPKKQNFNFVLDLLSKLVEDKIEDYHFFYLIQEENGKKNILVDQLRTLQEEFQTTSSDLKIALIKNAELLNEQASNSILKFIEEPAENQMIFLYANSVANILPTINSRVQQIILPELSVDELVDEYSEFGLDPKYTYLLAQVAANKEIANELQNDAWFFNVATKVEQWIEMLQNKNHDAFIFVEGILMKYLKTPLQQTTFPLIALNLLEQKSIENVNLLNIFVEELDKSKFNINMQTTLEKIAIRSFIS
ncbi:MAG: hypothetical protein LBC17_02460 [Lactobacillaceae bacterium]|jgi:hypothetical protein|nr:hypothetical protein [Lactobacillaceae bacterium]